MILTGSVTQILPVEVGVSIVSEPDARNLFYSLSIKYNDYGSNQLTGFVTTCVRIQRGSGPGWNFGRFHIRATNFLAWLAVSVKNGRVCDNERRTKIFPSIIYTGKRKD